MSSCWFERAFGLELQLDAPTRQGVRLGGRVELASGNSGGCARCGDGTLLQLGPRARLGPVALGAELVTVHSSEYGSAYGFEVGVAVSGRPGKYALGASAIGGAVLGIAVLVLISQASTH